MSVRRVEFEATEAQVANCFIRIDEHSLAMFSVDYHHGNILAHLARKDDGTHEVRLRNRVYKDDKLGPESKDHKTYWQIHDTSTRESEAIENMRGFVNSFAEMAQKVMGKRADRWEVVRGARSVEEFMELVSTMPGMHVGKLSEPADS